MTAPGADGWEERLAAREFMRRDVLIRNEQNARAANERSAEGLDRADAEHDTTLFVCECGDSACTQTVRLTARQWQQIHERGDRFVVIPGHVIESIEQVVDRRDGYEIVQKDALPA